MPRRLIPLLLLAGCALISDEEHCRRTLRCVDVDESDTPDPDHTDTDAPPDSDGTDRPGETDTEVVVETDDTEDTEVAVETDDTDDTDDTEIVVVDTESTDEPVDTAPTDVPVDTDTGLPDTDGDGLSDALENTTCTDPHEPDSDHDGIPDGVEDADHDGVRAGDESDPCDGDSDHDGLPDGVEDRDHDGMLDAGETDPLDPDSDLDGLFDGDEDANHDGVVDATETDPTKADTDGDGAGDASDCEARDADVYPGKVESCDGTDEDCDGTADVTRMLLDPIQPGSAGTWQATVGSGTVSEVTSRFDGSTALRLTGVNCAPCEVRKPFEVPSVPLGRSYLELDYFCSKTGTGTVWTRLNVDLFTGVGGATSVHTPPPLSANETGCPNGVGGGSSNTFTAGDFVSDRVPLSGFGTTASPITKIEVGPAVDAPAGSTGTVEIDQITLVVEACP